MKVGSKKNVGVFRFQHNGTNIRFSVNYQAISVSYSDLDIDKPTDEVIFDFRDLTEVEALIKMLTEFREGVIREIGCWRRDY